ncbi:MAG: 8-oxo-dGTP diphosphatase [Alphaproteobacteria bacterium]
MKNKVGNLVLIEDIKVNKILLIEKKRGHLKGYYNFPGGKKEELETSVQAAIRETEEETNLKIEQLKKIGELYFENIIKGRRFFVECFYTNKFEGEAKESEECSVFWKEKSEIDFSRFYESDKIWIPLFLEQIPFCKKFIYDSEKKKTVETSVSEKISSKFLKEQNEK